MPSPIDFPRTTKLRHLIVGLILLSGYSYVEQLAVHNSYLQKDNTFPVHNQYYNESMSFVLERTSDFSDKDLHVTISLNDGKEKLLQILCHDQGCMDHITLATGRYRPLEIVTIKTPFGDEFIRSMIYRDRYADKDVLFIQDKILLRNYYLNIKFKLASFLGLHLLLLAIVGFTLYPNKAFAKNVRFKDTLIEVSLLIAFFFTLKYLSGIMFNDIPLDHIEYYPLIVLMLVAVAILALYASENIIVRYDFHSGTIEVHPSSINTKDSKEESETTQNIHIEEDQAPVGVSVRQKINIIINENRGKSPRRKFDELPGPKHLDDSRVEFPQTTKTSSRFEVIKGAINIQGKLSKSRKPLNNDKDFVSSIYAQLKSKIQDLRNGNYQTKTEKHSEQLFMNATLKKDLKPQPLEKKFISIDEISEIDVDKLDIDQELLDLMAPKKRDHFH